MNDKQKAIANLKGEGYCVISRSGCIASRIDRPDWREFMSSKRMPESADLYRRCYSLDRIEIPSSWIKELKNSSDGYGKFKLKREKPMKKG